MSEQWKSVVGYEGIYEVSSYGNVRSVDRKIQHKDGKVTTQKGKLLKQSIHRKGYPIVYLSKGSKKRTVKIHRLVAEAFIPKQSGRDMVNHKDENKCNNHVNNLEWCDASYNVNYGTGLDRMRSKLSKPVLGTCVETGKNISYPSAKSAEQDGFYSSNVIRCCNGQLKTHHGYTWKYI